MNRAAAHVLLIASLICPPLAATSFAHDNGHTHSHASSRAEAHASASASSTVTVNGRTTKSASSSYASVSASAGHTHNGHTHYDKDDDYDEDYDYGEDTSNDDGYRDRSRRDDRYRDTTRRTRRQNERTRRDRRRHRHPHGRADRGQTHRCSSSCDHHHRHYDGCGHAGYEDTYEEEYVEAMSDREFSRFIAQIQAEDFSSGRLRVIQVAAGANYFTSSQVTAVIQLLTFGSNKVDAAVVLYPRVVDQDDFYQVLAAFTFEANKRKVRKRLNI